MARNVMSNEMRLRDLCDNAAGIEPCWLQACRKLSSPFPEIGKELTGNIVRCDYSFDKCSAKGCGENVIHIAVSNSWLVSLFEVKLEVQCIPFTLLKISRCKWQNETMPGTYDATDTCHSVALVEFAVCLRDRREAGTVRNL